MFEFISVLRERLDRNVADRVREMTPQQWIRLVVIVCGYLLLRPYLVTWGKKQAMKGHEAANKDTHERGKKTNMDANDLRNMVDIPEDTESEGEPERESNGGKATKVTESVRATEWGTKARRRQRRVVRKILEEEEKRIQETLEDEEDKDIEEFLED